MWDEREREWIEIDGGGDRCRRESQVRGVCHVSRLCYMVGFVRVMFTHFSMLCHGFQKRVYGKRVLEKKKTLMLRKDEHMLLVLIQTPAGGVAVTHPSLSGRGSQKILLSLESADKRDFARRIYGSF